MSFGFAIGDFIAVGKLVADIVSSLKDSGGSEAEYRDLTRELECLQSALIHLDRLAQTEESRDLDSIKYAALSCRRPLEEFLARIRKYDRSLGVQSDPNPVKRAIGKIKFPLGHSDEIRKLQAYLSVHIGSINILLAEHGLERMELATEKSQKDRLQIKERLEDTASLLSRIQTSVVCQAQAVFKNISMLEKVYKFLSGELKASLQSFEGAVAKVCVSTQQIYAVVLEIQTSIAENPDVRWTFFQDPIVVEDALGRKFPVPSEYDYSLLDTIINHRFQDGPGAVQVSAGHYEIMDAKNRLHILSVDSQLRPGGTVAMAILVGRPLSTILTDECCPMPWCQSIKTTKVRGGGRQCCECNVWFDQSTKQVSSLSDLWSAHEMLSAAEQPNVSQSQENSSERKRKRPLDDCNSMVPFKNVKLADSMVIHENSASEISPLLGSDTISPYSPSLSESEIDSVKSGYPIEQVNQGRPVPVSFDTALAFVNKVKTRLQDKPEIYRLFLEALRAYQQENRLARWVFDQVTSLLHLEPDLCEDFKRFLPPGTLLPFEARS